MSDSNYSCTSESDNLASHIKNINILNDEDLNEANVELSDVNQDNNLQTIPVISQTTAKEHLIILKDYDNGIYYRLYDTEMDMPNIMTLITKDLSEPYSIYTYRYFIHNWPHLCILAFTLQEEDCVGAIVCKLECHGSSSKRGYIAMLAVEQDHRRKRIGSSLVKLVIDNMASGGCDEVVLETEITNKPAMQLYEKLGFCRDKRLFRYYLNGVDAYRLKLWLK